MSRIQFTVVIVTFNRCKDLAECLDSLVNLDEPPNEIIVVDSNSTDGTRELVAKYPVKFLSINERSMVKARNVGFQQSKNEIVAYVDDDVVVTRDWPKYLLDPYEDKRVGGVVGRVIPYDEKQDSFLPAKHWEIGKVYDNGLILGNFDVPTPQPIEVDTAIGCNMSFRKQLLLRVGGFDESFRGSCFRDDSDLSLRLKRLNFKIVYHPRAIVRHKFKGKTVNNKWFYWTVYNHTYFYLKNFQPITIRRIMAFLFAMLIPPSDYLKKTGIRIKLTPLAITHAVAGLTSAILVHRKIDPTFIERGLRIT